MLSLDARAKQQFRTVIYDTGNSAALAGTQSTDDNAQAYFDEQAVFDGPIGSRLPILGRLNGMAQDKAWDLPRLDQKFITATFRYLLAHANCLLSIIESQLLQALAIDLLTDDCRAELEAYDEFCLLRTGTENAAPFEIQTRRDWLRYRREMLQKDGKRRFFGMRRSTRRKTGHM